MSEAYSERSRTNFPWEPANGSGALVGRGEARAEERSARSDIGVGSHVFRARAQSFKVCTAASVATARGGQHPPGGGNVRWEVPRHRPRGEAPRGVVGGASVRVFVQKTFRIPLDKRSALWYNGITVESQDKLWA